MQSETTDAGHGMQLIFRINLPGLMRKRACNRAMDVLRFASSDKLERASPGWYLEFMTAVYRLCTQDERFSLSA